MATSEGFVAVVPLVPVVSYGEIGAEFGRVEMRDPSSNGSVYYGGLVFDGMVAQTGNDYLKPWRVS